MQSVRSHLATRLATRTASKRTHGWTSFVARSGRERSSHTRARSGLTLIEVLVASVILSIAGLAALELLASGDAASLHARRHAMASVEAERALSHAADAVRNNRSANSSELIPANDGSEALAGCTVTVSEIHEFTRLASGSGSMVRVPVVRLVAEVTTEDGALLASVERLAPHGAAEVEP